MNAMHDITIKSKKNNIFSETERKQLVITCCKNMEEDDQESQFIFVDSCGMGVPMTNLNPKNLLCADSMVIKSY